MTTKIIGSNSIKDLRLSAIAKKHGCTTDYVSKVLKGERESNSILAQKILQDAYDIVEILERDTKVTV